MAETATPAAPASRTVADVLASPALAEEIRVGLDRMRHMSHDELRALVASRVTMLENVLKEREQRREALETARLAASLLEIRRERSEAIRRHVNAWSAVAAALCFAAVLTQF